MIALLGSLMALVGAIWIAVIAFQNDDMLWGILSIFCGIAAIIYGVQHFDQAKLPLGLLVLGIIIGGVGRVMAIQTNSAAF
jgi:1,4-dihydroxy-2-naphthoate octaprenyltransferase